MRNQIEKRKNFRGSHILAKNCATETDTWKSKINNNVMIYGPSGAGKTRHYVRPNILNGHESMIISDTKGSLYQELAPELKKKGYKIKNINFLDLAKGSGYNPLDYIHYDEERDLYSEKDIRTLTYCLVKNLTKNDPYWDNAARQFLHCLISYVLEALPEEEHTMEFVVRLLNKAGTNELRILMEELGELKEKRRQQFFSRSAT